MTGPPTLTQPLASPRAMKLQPLTLMPAAQFPLEKIVSLKQAEGTPVFLAFPVSGPQEADNLGRLLEILRPLLGTLVDQVWVASSSRDPGALGGLQKAVSNLEIFLAPQHLPPDQVDVPLGKGAAMRALIHYLIVARGLRHPRAVIQFLDADILPAYFHPHWVAGPVGAVLHFHKLDAAKVVYWRPRGGRLNTMLRALLAQIPHGGVARLQSLAYLLSGEIAGTLNWWVHLPFRHGYGVEIQILLSLALPFIYPTDSKKRPLEHVAQVYVGRMDHRHAPLTTSAGRRGLDQMAAAVFFTLVDTLARLDVLDWGFPGPREVQLTLPIPRRGGKDLPAWKEVTVKEEYLQPLSLVDEVRRALFPEGLRCR
ncbi:MAG: hypothetical protein FJ128_00300 [Deltaproteobacteria bacterium]|nr:hypothetical protein [Deltaproteobacteria bacterium]